MDTTVTMAYGPDLDPRNLMPNSWIPTILEQVGTARLLQSAVAMHLACEVDDIVADDVILRHSTQGGLAEGVLDITVETHYCYDHNVDLQARTQRIYNELMAHLRNKKAGAGELPDDFTLTVAVRLLEGSEGQLRKSVIVADDDWV